MCVSMFLKAKEQGKSFCLHKARGISLETLGRKHLEFYFFIFNKNTKLFRNYKIGVRITKKLNKIIKAPLNEC